MKTSAKIQDTGCCPAFGPKPWDQKTITWKEKKFVKDHVTSILHIPINFGQVMTKNMEKIEAVKALAQPIVVLSDENSLWGSDLYIGVKKDVPDAVMTVISGTFLTKVYEGQFKDMGLWIKDMHAYVQKQRKQLQKLYFFYTTCPKCAKVYGHNYVVLFAKI